MEYKAWYLGSNRCIGIMDTGETADAAKTGGDFSSNTKDIKFMLGFADFTIERKN